MNILLDDLPECVYICGKPYRVNTDFRTWIRFELLFENREAGAAALVLGALNLCFKAEHGKKFALPPSLDETLKALTDFYRCGESAGGKTHETGGKSGGRLYSFESDGAYIYAAFSEQYGIDLQNEKNMHWWRFRTLFSALNESTKFGEIVSIRAINLHDISDKKQRAHYRKLKRIYALKDKRSDAEKENDLGDALW